MNHKHETFCCTLSTSKTKNTSFSGVRHDQSRTILLGCSPFWRTTWFQPFLINRYDEVTPPPNMSCTSHFFKVTLFSEKSEFISVIGIIPPLFSVVFSSSVKNGCWISLCGIRKRLFCGLTSSKHNCFWAKNTGSEYPLSRRTWLIAAGREGGILLFNVNYSLIVMNIELEANLNTI